VLTQKKQHPDKVILTRVGEFYETYGVDALMLIEYAGTCFLGVYYPPSLRPSFPPWFDDWLTQKEEYPDNKKVILTRVRRMARMHSC